MLAFELGEGSWLLGFSRGYGSGVLRKKVAGRDTAAVLAAIELAKKHFKLPTTSQVVSCYEAGRDGFWLHRWLEARNVRNFVIDSAENPRFSRYSSAIFPSPDSPSCALKYRPASRRAW